PLALLRDLVETVLPARSRLRPILDRLRTLPGTSADSVFVKDVRGRYLFMNDAGAALLGRSAPQVVGRRDADIFDSPTLSEEVRASDEAVLRTFRPTLYLNGTRAAGVARLFM